MDTKRLKGEYNGENFAERSFNFSLNAHKLCLLNMNNDLSSLEEFQAFV